jgi:TonB family protein
MNVSWWLNNLLAYSLQIALLALVGSALPVVFRVRTPALMLAYWRTLLATSLLLPVIQPWKPAFPNSATGDAIGVVPIIGYVSIHGLENAALRPLIYDIAACLLLAGGLVHLSWLGLGLYRLSRYRKSARELSPLPATIEELQSRLAVSSSVYLSTEVDSPVTFGWRRPTIILPLRFLKMDAGAQRAIACHELLHVYRRDWVWALPEEIIRALFWFHPGIWWLVGRIQLSREQSVDRQVLQLTHDRESYLQALLEIAQASEHITGSPATLFLSEHQLTQRIALILKEAVMSKSRTAFSLSAMFGLLLLSGQLAVWSFPLSALPHLSQAFIQQQASSDPEPSQSKNAEGIKLTHKADAVYPQEAKDKGIEGKVAVEITINAQGEISQAKAIDGPEALRQVAIDAALQCKFANPLKQKVAATLTYNFMLGKKQEKTTPSASNSPAQQEGLKLIKRVDPVYPQEAMDKGVEGKVVIEITINEQGEVSDVKVKEGPELLRQAAIDAVRQYRFSNPLKQGVKISLTLNFEL